MTQPHPTTSPQPDASREPAGYGRCAVDAQRLAEAFCAWPLPASVCADLCATDRTYAFSRAGTNLLTVAEARAMFDHLVGAGLLLPAVDRKPRADLNKGDPTGVDLLNSLLVDVDTLCASVLGDAYLGSDRERELAEALRAEAANTDAAALAAPAHCVTVPVRDRPRPGDTSIVGPVDGMNERHPEGSYFRLVVTHDDDTERHRFLLSRGEAEMLQADLGVLLSRATPSLGPAGADGAATGGDARAHLSG